MTDTKDLPDLTAKQFKFVQAILEGKTASDAYRAAYDVSSFTDPMIWVEAHRVKNSPNVSLWLSKARTEALHSAVQTKEAYLKELQRLSAECEKTGNLGAAVKATELQGKVMGHYVDKHEDVTPEEKMASREQGIKDVLRRIQTNPRLSAVLDALEDGENTTSH